MNAAFPYRLRLEHEGFAGLRLERPGRRLRIDPAQPIRDRDIVLITAPYPERLAQIQQVSGATVVAPAPILDWLSARTTIDGRRPSLTIDGVKIEMFPYGPPPITARDLAGKVQGLALRPIRTLRRWAQRAREPEADPQIVFLTFPDGERLVHLNLSLHQETDAEWLAAVQKRSAGAEWLLVDVPYGEADAVLKHVSGFDVQRVIFTDVTAEVRRDLSRPAQLLTPTVDRAVSEGIEAYVCVSQASFRFE